ncbi:hypothetical protein TWF506_008883 [Arthrobotrys conoides]|uniref:Transcription elongation factor Eaf N-terminal domain-containing protein n=1 Tax=Arthrobotrys conoides TaxID=74498 RepID=A0AAN8RX39_9PEZI
MATATTVAPVEFNSTRQGKFKVLIGDSLKPGAEDAQSANVYSSFRYNTTPPSGPSKLSRTGTSQFNLSYEDDKEISYTGAQRPGRKLECILVYNPKDNTFTLERTSSVFTFNQSHPFSDIPSIPTATYEDEVTATVGNSDDEDAQLADAENPFDVRHFTTRVLPNSDEDEDEREDQKEEDTDIEMEDVDAQATATELELEQETAVTPGQSASTPIPSSSATATPNPSLGVIKRKTKVVNPFMKPTRKQRVPAASNTGKSPLLHPDMAANGKEASMSPQPRLPSPMHIDRKPAARKGRVQQKEESSESDIDSSDEEDDRRRPLPVNKHIQSVAMSREPSFSGSILSNNAPDELEFPDPKSEDKGDAEDDDFDLDAAMAEEFMDDDDEGGGGGGGELTIEGEDDNRSGIGLGIGNISGTAVPVSLSSMMGGRRRDESEEESSEEE